MSRVSGKFFCEGQIYAICQLKAVIYALFFNILVNVCQDKERLKNGQLTVERKS